MSPGGLNAPHALLKKRKREREREKERKRDPLWNPSSPGGKLLRARAEVERLTGEVDEVSRSEVV